MKSAVSPMPDRAQADDGGSTQRVYLGILQDLEERRMVPGQRLIETDLAARFGVGRNAVREAMQRLAVRGVIDLSRHRSPAIRLLDLSEMLEVLDVAAALISLAASVAARRFDPAHHARVLEDVMQGFTDAGLEDAPGQFSRSRRRFYRAVLQIGGNRELQRIFPTVGIHIIYAQFQSPRLQHMRVTDYQALRDAIVAGDEAAAVRESVGHVERVRDVILAMSRGSA